MKAIITGITGLRNRGVEALVVPTVEQLQKRQPNLSVNVLTNTIDYDQLRLEQYQVNSMRIGFPRTKLQQLRAKSSFLYKNLAPDYQSCVDLIKNASVVIASGGDVFSSDYGVLNWHLQPLEIALKAGVPVVFLAQSIGPFKRKEEAEAWLRVARRSKLITIREKLSYKYVTETLGLAEDFVKFTADPAFLLAPPSPEQVTNLRRYYGIEEDRPVIAIAISKGISRYASNDADSHLKAWHEVVKLIVDEFDAQVLIVPHVQDISVENDDRVAATQLLKILDFDHRVRLVGGNHSASEFKGLIGSCDMVIAERMHAAIAGLSSGTCTVAVGYSVKAEGIMTDLLGNEASDVLIPFQKFLEVDTAISTIRNAWNKREQIATKLKEVLPGVKQESAKNFDLISEILR